MTRPRNRRALLRTGVLAVGGLAGCIGGLGEGPAETTSERRTATGDDSSATVGTDEPTDTSGPSAVEFVPVGVQSSFFYCPSPDSVAVVTAEETQFAFVEVRPQTDSPPPSDFSLVADGRRFWGTLAPGDIAGPHRVYERGSGYHSGETDPGWVAFEVPNPLDADDIALAYQDRRESVEADLAGDLREPPAEFSPVSFDAPETVAHDETFEVSLTVENVGESDGIFRACLNQLSPAYAPHPAELSVPVGERREYTWSFGDRISAETDEIGLRLELPDDRRRTSVEVVGGTTAEE